MVHQCPDEQCKAKIEDMLIDMKSKNRMFKILGFGFGLFGVGVLSAVLYTWADVRSFPTTYCSIAMANDIARETIRRDQIMEIKQVESDKDIKYLIQGVDDIKLMLRQIHR